MAEPNLTAANYAFLAHTLRAQSGMTLDPGKEYLVRARLLPLVQKYAANSLDGLVDRLRLESHRTLLADIVEAMVTTETYFFRDVHPFETLRRVIFPQLIELRRAQRQLNVWCAASASGQEPYSIAILLQEYFSELENWQVNLVATDISQEMVQRARAGRYSQVEINRGLPTHLMLKWFRQEGAQWQIDERLRKAVKFSQLNLSQPWPSMPCWDLVLLRNVMIYFDNDLKRTILGRISRLLAPTGYLLLGGAETTLNLDDSFSRQESLKSGFYQLKRA